MKCKCVECGKTWERGEEGDNETLCLRCERESLIEDMTEDEYHNLDRMESEQ